MEKGGFFPAEMNCGPADHHLAQLCSINLNWDQPAEQSSRFGSSLSSVVSSPSDPSLAGGGAENVVIRELIGRLGSICNSGEISPQPYHYLNGGIDSAAASCYSTPLGSPSKLNLSAYGNAPASGTHFLQGEPRFDERTARLLSSSFFGGFPAQFVLPEAVSGISSSKSLVGGGLQAMQERPQMEVNMMPNFGAGLSNSSTPDNGEESSVSNHTMASTDVGPRGAGESGGRKRKAAQRGKPKDSTLSSTTKEIPKMEAECVNAKRTKSSENILGTGKDEVKPKMESSSGSDSAIGEQKPGKENNPKPPEPPKQDYIHVRARRGQATDSHSLAERVRREKISERMKFLQDLVPGCNKVTGKAVMLDEIINYVQSLQRQVEFLSMKLATVNPRLDFNVETLLQKDSHQAHGLLSHGSLPMEMPGAVFPLSQGSLFQSILTSGMENLCSMNPLDASFRTAFNLQPPRLDGFVDGSSQIGNYWDDDLQHVAQMGFGQDQEAALSSQTFHGVCPTSHMKVEL